MKNTEKKEIKVGNKIKFKSEKQRYVVRACNNRFVICTKPFNAKKTYLYSIIDFKRGVRGPDDLIFGCPFDYITEADKCLEMLNKGEMEVSYRHNLKLDIEKVYEK